MSEHKNPIEIAKQKLKVVDQTASMHFKLSDKYKKWTRTEDIINKLFSMLTLLCSYYSCKHRSLQVDYSFNKSNFLEQKRFIIPM